MSSANIGWLFYKDYFNGLDYKDILDKKEERNSAYIDSKVAQIVASKFVETEEEVLGSSRFQATTTYPGLMLGSGNAHEVPNVKGQAILGFHFDYTSGLPVIQGSSVKGVLKSAFKHPEYIQELLSDDTINVKDLEEEIFDNADVFFDAHIIKADSMERILGDDFLTPHKDVLKDPIPLRFIKVLPDVTFLFEFELLDGILSKVAKESLFKKILEDLGLGAKTNVGYGKFIDFKNGPRSEAEKIQDDIDAKNKIKAEQEKREAKEEAIREAKRLAEDEKKNRLANAAQEELDAAQAKIDKLASQGIAEAIKEAVKFKALEGILKKYVLVKSLDDNDKKILEDHVLNNMNDKIKKKRFPFAAFNDERCLGKERTEKLVNTLNLK